MDWRELAWALGQSQGHPGTQVSTGTGSQAASGSQDGRPVQSHSPHLRLSLFVHPVDLAPNKHSDLAFAPSPLAVQEIGDEEGEAWQGQSQEARGTDSGQSPLCFHPTLPQ